MQGFLVTIFYTLLPPYAAGGGRDARDMRNMDLESRLRDGKSTASWKEMGGFEKHTKVAI